MKNRFWTTVICSMMCLSVFGCNNSLSELPSGEKTEYDAPMEYSVISDGWCNVANLDDVYYMRGFHWLFYSDVTSGISGKLCAKPECLHVDETCNAYLGPGATGVQVYDGAIYWIAGNVVWKAELSGANRQVVQMISDMKVNRFVIHRGYIYTSVRQETVVEGKSMRVLTIKRYELGNDKGELVFEKKYEEGIAAYMFKFYLDKMYLFVDSGGVIAEPLREREIYIYDIEENKMSLLCEEQTEWRIRGMYVDDDGIFVAEDICGNTGIERAQLVQYYFLNGDTEVLQEYEVADRIGAINIGRDYFLLQTGLASEIEDVISVYQLYDWKGNLIKEGEIIGRDVCLGGYDETGFIMTQFYDDLGEEGYYFTYRLTQIPVEGEDVTLLHLSEKEC